MVLKVCNNISGGARLSEPSVQGPSNQVLPAHGASSRLRRARRNGEDVT